MSREQPKPDHIIEAALGRATNAAASYLTAAHLGASEAELDPLIDAIYDPLREALGVEDLLRAVALLIAEAAEVRARQRLRDIRELDHRDGGWLARLRRSADPVDAHADGAMLDPADQILDGRPCEENQLITEIYALLKEHAK